MRLQYVALGKKAEIVVHGAGTMEYLDINQRISSFIHHHKHFPLRDYYRLCKTANPSFRDWGEDEDVEKQGKPLVTFHSTWEQHKPYFAVLQEKLNLVIENLPE